MRDDRRHPGPAPHPPRRPTPPPPPVPDPPAPATVTADLLAPLALRGIGPALMSGRIADVAVDPTNRSVWYVATASSNVWKTENRGTTWTPIFDDYPSYSTGAIAIDPGDANVIWLGTGENTSQRSVGWGDGVYKSLDGGRSWTNTGLRTSEHIGKILIDPRNSDVAYAAAMGGLWAPGGERGLYKTVDGGATWEAALEISEHTGIADVHFDPRDPDVLYAVAYQRRRHVGVLVAGGPESGVWKSTDGGETWRDITDGLPSGDLGRIALAVSPVDPDVVYALVAAAEDRSGFYRSPDRGETWRRMSDYIVVDPQYYGELYPDPHRMDRVYAVDVIIHVTDDGGRTFNQVNTRFRHVDNHAIVFDPDDPNYMLVGTDGGLYETFDRTQTWRYVPNLPLTQFYRVGIDNKAPFYTVYGGTQDNSSVGGPSRTDNVHGIRSSDWFITHGGDGFQVRVDPDDPNIVYTQSQYAGIVRYDRASGEELDIQPQPEAGEGALRWHWDSPLIISPHNPRRIYFAAQKLFRSDDRAETWAPVSGDLSRGLDRNQRPVMGRIWPPEAVWKNVFTSPFGTIVAFDESPLVEGLLYVGTDDGLVQVSEDGGGSWRRQDAFPGVPDMTYVADVVASRHDPDRVYAVFNNHKEGDFRPYVARSDDRGRTWRSIAARLPEGQASWTLVEDHADARILFVGTEFGLFVTLDGGDQWARLNGGLPTIAVRDLEIQRRENDLVLATFGRGFYILDDYSPLRQMREAVAAATPHLFPVKDPWAYIAARPLGGQEKGTLGDSFFTAPNPPFGAVFTYYLPSAYESRKERRQRLEREALARGDNIAYPDRAALAAEDVERPPEVFAEVSDATGAVVRRVPAPRRAGLHRIAWDLRYASLTPPSSSGDEPSGPMVAPGEFSVRLVLATSDAHQEIAAPQSFRVRPLGTATLAAADREELLAFQREVAQLQRAAVATDRAARATTDRLALLRRAVRAAPGVDAGPFEARIAAFEERLFEIGRVLSRDRTALDRAEFAPPSVLQRISRIVGAQFRATSAPTTTQRDSYAVASTLLAETSAALRELVEVDAVATVNRAVRAAMPAAIRSRSGLAAPATPAHGPAATPATRGWSCMWLGVAATLAALACEPGAIPAPVVRSDSAGIPIATVTAPAWGPGEGWTVQPEPLVAIGTVTGAPEYQFADVAAAVRLANGDIVVADGGAHELRAYDPTGAFRWATGRFGEGPGEFQSLDFVGVFAGDSLVTYDNALVRVQVFDAHGAPVRTLRVALAHDEAEQQTAVPDKVVGVVGDQLVFRFVEYGDDMPTGIVRWPLERVVALDLADGSTRSLMLVPGHEAEVTVREGGRYSIASYVFFKGPEFGAGAGRVAMIDTEAWSVRLASPRDGAIDAIVRRDVVPLEATAALLDLHLDGIVKIAFPDPDQAAPEDVDGLRRMWRERPRATTLPVLRSVHVDATGHVWLQPYFVAGAEPPPFEVHAPDGTWLGAVSLPQGLDRAFVQYQTPYLEIGADYVLGVWKGELDVQQVRMYRIAK